MHVSSRLEKWVGETWGMLAVIYLSLALRLDWQRSFRLIAAAALGELWLGTSSGALGSRLVGLMRRDACHTAGSRGGIKDATLRCRRDAKGKVNFGVCCTVSYLTACVRACTTMMAARIYAAAWSEEEKVKLDETKFAAFSNFRSK